MSKLTPVLSANWDEADSFTIAGYKRNGGYTALTIQVCVAAVAQVFQPAVSGASFRRATIKNITLLLMQMSQSRELVKTRQ